LGMNGFLRTRSCFLLFSILSMSFVHVIQRVPSNGRATCHCQRITVTKYVRLMIFMICFDISWDYLCVVAGGWSSLLSCGQLSGHIRTGRENGVCGSITGRLFYRFREYPTKVSWKSQMSCSILAISLSSSSSVVSACLARSADRSEFRALSSVPYFSKTAFSISMGSTRVLTLQVSKQDVLAFPDQFIPLFIVYQMRTVTPSLRYSTSYYPRPAQRSAPGKNDTYIYKNQSYTIPYNL